VIGRLLTDIGNVTLVLLLAAVPGSLFIAFLSAGNLGDFLFGMLFLVPLAGAGLLLASPFLIALTLFGHRSWWSRICVAICAGAVLALIMLYESSPDPHKAFDPPAAFGSAVIGAFFGLWAGAWWCFFFRGRAEKVVNPRWAPASA
jgi:hypothetical protein